MRSRSVQVTTLVSVAALLSTAPAYGQATRAVDSGRPGVTSIVANDNRRPAGRLQNGILTLRLEARDGMWFPDGGDTDGTPIGAFAEEGGPLQIPGPLIRVTVGTEVRATISNLLKKPLAVFGLGSERGFVGDSMLLAPGEVHEFAFVAREPGTYYYLGQPIPGDRFIGSLHGALIVDPPGKSVRPGDRVFVISSWFTLVDNTVSNLSDDAVITANGLEWPNTEKVELTQGDTVEWRWINMTNLQHPMHLHGFHFRVDARGNGARDTLYAADHRWQAVTELVSPGNTLTTVWSPNRPGNWIFHCHLASHMTAISIVQTPHSRRGAAHGNDALHQMGGLVVGIRVKPLGQRVADAGDARKVRLLVRSRPRVYGENMGYSFVLGGSPDERDPQSLPIPGPTLVLEKDRAVAINIINQSHEPAAVHWHGIELQSYPDGVPGWSGEGNRVLPSIPPRDSLTVTFTPPRAGTFMYHSHFNEMQQIGSGLYGPIVVVPAGQRYDPETDRILIFSDGGPWLAFGPNASVPPIFLNGRQNPEPMHFEARKTYRLRFINIRTEDGHGVALLRGEEPIQWRAIARDGADLPASLATLRPARFTFMPGQIHDFEFTPAQAGELTLVFGGGDTLTRVRVIVR